MLLVLNDTLMAKEPTTFGIPWIVPSFDPFKLLGKSMN